MKKIALSIILALPSFTMAQGTSYEQAYGKYQATPNTNPYYATQPAYQANTYQANPYQANTYQANTYQANPYQANTYPAQAPANTNSPYPNQSNSSLGYYAPMAPLPIGFANKHAGATCSIDFTHCMGVDDVMDLSGTRLAFGYQVAATDKCINEFGCNVGYIFGSEDQVEAKTISIMPYYEVNFEVSKTCYFALSGSIGYAKTTSEFRGFEVDSNGLAYALGLSFNFNIAGKNLLKLGYEYLTLTSDDEDAKFHCLVIGAQINF